MVNMGFLFRRGDNMLVRAALRVDITDHIQIAEPVQPLGGHQIGSLAVFIPCGQHDKTVRPARCVRASVGQILVPDPFVGFLIIRHGHQGISGLVPADIVEAHTDGRHGVDISGVFHIEVRVLVVSQRIAI